jgi:geranylgeranyl diphosphate synthase type I
LDAEGLRERVQKTLDDVLSRQADVLEQVSSDIAPLMEAITDLLAGGKRLRPAFCYWGWRGAGGPDCAEIVTVASALELFQAAALLHDDVMDGSDTRRGMPSAHRRLAALHRGNGWLGSSEDFGVAGAILAGDLCLSWCDEIFTQSALDPGSVRAGRQVFDLMRTELMAGQYLDMLEQVQTWPSLERARHVIQFKSARYTVQRPLVLGGTLAGASPALLEGYTRYGLAIGEAFQLRDDVLGVFGDPSVTGKPAGDDLREGKRTVLMALAVELASPAQAAAIRRMLGDRHLDEAGVTEMRGIIAEVGALDRVESMIGDLCDSARTSLQELVPAGIEADAREVLESLVLAATARTG